MSTLSIPPKNMLILAAVGIAMYTLTTKKARASSAAGPARANATFFRSPSTAQFAANGQPVPSNGAGGILGMLGSLLGGNSRPASLPASNAPAAIANSTTVGQEGYGWQYFNDGTAISPNGVYYKDGTQVWAPTQPDVVVNNNPNAYNSSSGTDTWGAEGF